MCQQNEYLFYLSGEEPVDRVLGVELSRSQDTVWKVLLVDGVRKVLGLQTESTMLLVIHASLAKQIVVLGKEIAWKTSQLSSVQLLIWLVRIRYRK